MKFVCENCKAKYQISDDKVAGRTLRMKCRRCGEMIQVAATVTESSVSQKLPAEQATGSAPSPIRATPPPRPAVEAADDASSADEGATVIRKSPFFHPEPVKPGPAPAPTPGMAPRPGGPRIVPPARASLAGTKSSRPPPRPSSPGPVPGAPMHSPSSPGLHAGFARAVATAPAAASQVAGGALPTEDWYVGIGGVPLGPVRLTVLRDKAAAGQVDGDSLVWREGFDEWQAIKSIQPLMALVDEAKQTRASRVSLPAVIPPTPRPSAPLAAAPAPLLSSPGIAVLPAPAPSLPFDLVRSGQSPAPAVVAPTPLSSVPGDPFSSAVAPPPPSARLSVPGAAPSMNGAAPAANGSANGYGLTTTAGLASSTAVSIGAPSSASPSVIPAPPSELSPQSLPAGKKRGGLPPAAWALIAMAAAFGGVAAWALFLRPKDAASPAPVVAQQQEQKGDSSQLGASPPPPPSPTANGETPPPGSSVATTPGGAGNPRGPVGPAVGSGTAKGGDSSPIDKTGFPGTPGGPSTIDPPPSGGGALTEGEINGVVSRNKPMITRRCWIPAYDARSSSAPKTAKVSVSLKVAPSGSVSSVSAGGSEAHYPGLASCVASSVKGWSFPPSDEGATINIPFSFSGQ